MKNFFYILLWSVNLFFTNCKKNLNIQKAQFRKNTEQINTESWSLIINKHFKNRENKFIYLKNNTGLGDKLLDIIGCSTLSKVFHIPVILRYVTRDHVESQQPEEYDLKYIKLQKDIEAIYSLPSKDETYQYHLTGFSLNPYNIFKIYEKLSRKKYNSSLLSYNENMNLQEIGEIFLKTAQSISFSEEINQRIPEKIHKAFGLHLRKSDKVSNNIPAQDRIHVHTPDEFEEYNKKLKNFLKDLIKQSDEKIFFICSEDKEWKKEFTNLLQDWGAEILEVSSFDASIKSGDVILDFAALSKSKMIIQGTKYSTFSMAASIIGNKPIVNMTNLEQQPASLVSWWRPYLYLISKTSTGWLIENQKFRDNEWVFKNNLSLNVPEIKIFTSIFVDTFLSDFLKIAADR